MKRICIVLSVMIVLVSSLFGEEKPLWVCGGSSCPEAWEEFIKSSPSYIILTANDYLDEDRFPGNYKIITIKTREQANRIEVEKLVYSANAIFWSGGDQYIYHKEWSNTKLSRAIQYQIGRIPILTTSASSMILGGKYFTAEKGSYCGGDKSQITMGYKFIDFSPFKHYVIDSHYSERKREARLGEFCDMGECKGIGLDEGACLIVIGNTLTELVKGKVHYIR